jgi:four helix bundle protein
MDAFEQLDVWKRSCRLCVSLYKARAGSREYGLRDQITRSALSIPSNIAEGYERNATREFVRYLKISKGSCGELRIQLYIAVEIGTIEKIAGLEFVAEAVEIAKMLQGLSKSLEARIAAEER